MTRVLVADDAAIVRKLMTEMLDAAGHAVVAQAATGDEAVRLFEEARPDVAVLDVNMPGLDGIAAAEAIRAADPGARIVLASVFVDVRRLERAREAGFGLIAKPFTAANLVDAVERAAS